MRNLFIVALALSQGACAYQVSENVSLAPSIFGLEFGGKNNKNKKQEQPTVLAYIAEQK